MKEQEMPSYPAHAAEIHFGSQVTAKELPEPVCVKVCSFVTGSRDKGSPHKTALTQTEPGATSPLLHDPC